MRCRRVILALALAAGLPAPEAFSHPGIGIVRDGQGSVFYTDLSQVWRIAPDGAISLAVPRVHTHELCLDAEGNLYGEHLWYAGDATRKWGHRVWRRRSDGAIETVIPPTEGFLTDYSFVRDAAGNMYSTGIEDRTFVRRRSPDGRTVDLVRGAGLQDIRWMTAAPDGTVHLIDGPDLKRITPEGRLSVPASGLRRRGLLSSAAADRHALMGLWTDTAGNVFVARMATSEVLKVTPAGTVEVVARSKSFWTPTGGLVAPDGSLWILEYGRNRARVRHLPVGGGERLFGPQPAGRIPSGP